jgi:hypothetical protein
MILDVVSKLVTDGFAPVLISRGFKLYKSLDFARKVGPVRQELGLVFNPVSGQEAGHVQVCPGFAFDEVQKRAAELQGVSVRKGWLTAGGNIGNLQTPSDFIWWEVTLSTDIQSLGGLIAKKIEEAAFPFWDRYTTLEALAEGYRTGDDRLMLGGQFYRWKYAAACCLLGRPGEARQALEEWKIGRPPESVIEAALARIG